MVNGFAGNHASAPLLRHIAAVLGGEERVEAPAGKLLLLEQGEFLERAIDELDLSPTVEHDDAKRAVFNDGMQMRGAFIELA